MARSTTITTASRALFGTTLPGVGSHRTLGTASRIRLAHAHSGITLVHRLAQRHRRTTRKQAHTMRSARHPRVGSHPHLGTDTSFAARTRTAAPALPYPARTLSPAHHPGFTARTVVSAPSTLDAAARTRPTGARRPHARKSPASHRTVGTRRLSRLGRFERARAQRHQTRSSHGTLTGTTARFAGGSPP